MQEVLDLLEISILHNINGSGKHSVSRYFYWRCAVPSLNSWLEFGDLSSWKPPLLTDQWLLWLLTAWVVERLPLPLCLTGRLIHLCPTSSSKVNFPETCSLPLTSTLSLSFTPASTWIVCVFWTETQRRNRFIKRHIDTFPCLILNSYPGIRLVRNVSFYVGYKGRGISTTTWGSNGNLLVFSNLSCVSNPFQSSLLSIHNYNIVSALCWPRVSQKY